MPDLPSTADNSAPPKKRRRWLQFSLRSLLIFTLICAVGASWVARRAKQKRNEQAAVDAILKRGGKVTYDLQAIGSTSGPTGPAWLRAILGDNFFSEVREVSFTSSAIDCTDADLEKVRELSGLRRLAIWQQYHVTDKGLRSLESLEDVESLRLSGTQITDAGLQSLQSLTRLKSLDLSVQSNVTNEGMPYLSTLSQLESLNLSQTNVGDEGLMRLCNLSKLRSLHLVDSNVSDRGLKALERFPQLQILSLGSFTGVTVEHRIEHPAGQMITDASVAHFKALLQLHRLDLFHTAITAAGQKTLQAALPKCIISVAP